MHRTVRRFTGARGTGAQKGKYCAGVVDSGTLFGSWGSEPAVSLSRTFLMETTVRRHPDVWVVDGIKHFCTMALVAGFYLVWCALDGEPDMGKGLLQVLVPTSTPGVETDGKWNTLGMRATFRPSVKLNRCLGGKDAALGTPGAAATLR